jgi:hypothetical protein
MAPCEDHFPRGTFAQEYNTEEVIRAWYATPLAALHAPCLRNFDPRGTQVYRFTWIPSFDPSVVTTVFLDGDECRVYAATVKWEIDTFIPWKVRDVEVGERVEVSPHEGRCVELASLIQQSAFWGMPTVDPEPGGQDGAQWILEGVRSHAYHVTDRWDPSAEYRRAFQLILEETGLYSERFKEY